ncbi:Gastric triacylglycerol lipase [Halotydeus destructor]|nr:Gastric triacylglycerol lipase [Halotydeus destructor]
MSASHIVTVLYIIHIASFRAQLTYDSFTLSRAVYDRDHDTCDIVKSRDYGCEIHEVITSDGYILTMHRLRNPMKKRIGKPVLLQHGRLSSDILWVLQGPYGDIGTGNSDAPVENELAFALARRGYDVWLGNTRGSTYSQKHVTLSPFSIEFWKYTNDEKFLIDLPAMLDHVLDHTKRKTMSYVGHSLGSAMMLGLTSRTTKYDESVKPAILVAPVWFKTNAKDILKTILVKQTWPLFINNPGPFAQSKMALGRGLYLISTLCFIPLLNIVCAIGWFLESGYDLPNLDITRLPVYLSHLPGGESTWSFLQNYNSNADLTYQVTMFDFGSPERNMAAYGSFKPPEYQVENITKTNLCTIRSSGQDDSQVQPQDYQVFKQRLKVKLLNEYTVPLLNFSHIDHVLAKTAGSTVNSHVLTLLKRYA